MTNDATPGQVASTDQLGLADETQPPQAYFSEDMLSQAVMAHWEEEMAALGICPKCSDSLARTSEGPGVRFSQCMGCGNIFVLKA